MPRSLDDAFPATPVDPTYPKRIGIALAVAVALHACVAGLWPRRAAPPPDAVVALHTVTIERRPPPSPRPTPRPTPAPVVTLAPAVTVRAPAARAAATPQIRLGGAAARKHAVAVRSKRSPNRAPAVSLAMGTQSGMQNGGAGTGAGAGAGTGGLAGSGTGAGTAGNGNAGDTNSGPCADVYILPGRTDYKSDGTVLQHVYVKVVQRDGDVELGTFPYPFVYPAERNNPFSHDDQMTASSANPAKKGVPVQTPPPGADVATMPPMVQFVLKYTNPQTGYATLPECNPDASPPSPQATSGN